MLEAALNQANFTQEQLAEKAGINKNYISKLENGKGNIQLENVKLLFIGKLSYISRHLSIGI